MGGRSGPHLGTICGRQALPKIGPPEGLSRRSTGVPGPGSYSPPSPNSPCFHFAASPRDAPEHKGPLGPGRYEIQEPARVVVAHDFEHSPRVLPGTLPPSWAPGPGAYATRRSPGDGLGHRMPFRGAHLQHATLASDPDRAKSRPRRTDPDLLAPSWRTSPEVISEVGRTRQELGRLPSGSGHICPTSANFGSRSTASIRFGWH